MTENRKRVSVMVVGQHKNATVRAEPGSAQHTVHLAALPVRASRHAETADRLSTPRQIEITGEAAGEGLFDGSEDIEIYTAIERITNTELEAILQ